MLNPTSHSSEESGETIFTTSREGSFALWDEYAKLAEGNYTHKHSTSQELGRFKNEKWKKSYIKLLLARQNRSDPRTI